MAARKTTNVPVMLFSLHPEVAPIYKKVLNILKKQRQVNDSELPIIATYSNQVYLNQRAMMSMVDDGVVLTSTTNHGEVEKRTRNVRYSTRRLFKSPSMPISLVYLSSQ